MISNKPQTHRGSDSSFISGSATAYPLRPNFDVRERIAKIVFFAHLAVSMLLIVMGLVMKTWDFESETLRALETSFRNIAVQESTSFSVSTILAVFSLELARLFPQLFLYFITLIAIILMGATSILMSLYSKIKYLSWISLIATVLFLAQAFFYRRTIKISSRILRSTIDIISQHPTLYYSFVFVAFLTYLLYRLAEKAATIIILSLLQSGRKPLARLCYMYAFYSALWTVQVIFNFARTVTAAIVQAHVESSLPKNNPVLTIVRKTWRNSFDAICYGSLLILPVSLYHLIVGTILVRPVTSPFYGGVGKYFNSYAFNYIIDGRMSYRRAAQYSWHRMQDTKTILVYGDNYAGIAIYYIYAMAALSSAFLVLFIHIAILDENILHAVSVFLGALKAATIVPISLIQTVQAGMLALIVAISHEPGMVKNYDAQLYQGVISSYPQLAFNQLENDSSA